MSPVSDSKIVFKRAGPEDASVLMSWIEQYYAYDHIVFDSATLETAIPDLLNHEDHGLAYFVETGAELIGYFILTFAFDLEFGGRHAVLTDFYFSLSQRRSGLGSKTFSFIESICTQKKLSHLLLQVEIDNVEAKAFYQTKNLITLSRQILVKKLENKSP